ncbi:MAG: hypothetical protein JNM10_07890 [Planctomycetia bacterium]|nr:hypothetical protein [Planctomycetia bacterium]
MRRAPLLALAAALTLLAVAGRPVAGDDVPRIRSVTPGSAFRGGTVDIVIEGQNLHPYDELKCSRSDVSVSLQPGPTPSKLVLRLVIPDTTPAGPLTLTIRTKSGVVKTEKFAVKLRAPAVTKVTPAQLVRGAEYDLRLEGTYLAFPGEEPRVTAEAPMVAKLTGRPSERAMSVRLTVPAETPVGSRAVTIETSDGKFTLNVTVLYAVPAVTALTPAATPRGATTEVVVAGKHLSGAKDVRLAVDDPGVVVAAAGAPTAAAVPLKIEVKPDAAPGPRVLVVRTPDGWVTRPFEVTTPAPALTALKPAGVARGAATNVAPTVERAPGDYQLRVLPADPAITVERQPSGAWSVAAAASAAPGPRTVVLDHVFGAAVGTFTVSLRSPTVVGFTPSELAPGAEADVAFEGQWLDGAEIGLASDDPSVAVTPKAPGVVHVKVSADARPGPRPIVVRTADGAAVVAFGIKGAGASGPSVTSVLPGRVPRGAPTEVVLAGVNLRSAGDQAPTVTATLGGVAIPASVVASNAASVKVRLEAPADAPAGGCVIVVRTSDGAAAGVTTVAPAIPTIAGATATPSSRPGDLVVVVTGTDLVGPGGAAPTVVLAKADGSDPWPAVVSAAAPTKLTVAVPVTAAAVPGPRVLVVTTSEGGAAVPVAVPAAVPEITALDPVTVGIPANLVVTVTGRNLLGPAGAKPVVVVTRLGAPATIRSDLLEATATSLKVRVITPPGTPAGTHVLTAKTADGTAAGLFEIVNAPMPTITGLAPAAGPRLATVTVALEGTGLLGLSGVAFSGEGVTAAIQPGATDTKVMLRVTVAKDAAPGARTVTVTAPGGTATGGKLVFVVE